MRAVITKTNPQDPSIWCETNFVEYPYFRLGNKNSAEKQILFEVKNGPYTAIWNVENASGLPGPLSFEIFTALEHLIDQNGIDQDGSLFFTIYQIIQILNYKSAGGFSYRLVKDAIKKLVETTITTEYTFLDKNVGKRAKYKKFSVLLECEFAEAAAASGYRNELSRVQFNTTYLANRRLGYTSPISAKVFFEELQSPLAKRLYQFLNKRAYHMAKRGEAFRIDCQEIGALMGIKTPYSSQILRTIDKANKELRKIGFLSDFNTQKSTRKSTELAFTFSQAFQDKEKALRIRNRGGDTQIHADLAQRLLALGFSSKDAGSLLTKSASSVRMALAQVDHDQRHKRQIKSPAGFIRQFVQNGWILPDYLQVKTAKHRNPNPQIAGVGEEQDPNIPDAEIDSHIKGLTPEARAALNQHTFKSAFEEHKATSIKNHTPETFDYFANPQCTTDFEYTALRAIQKSIVSERILERTSKGS